MTKDISGITHGEMNQTFTQGEEVMIRRLGDGNEYRAKIAGVSADTPGCKIMIVEMIDTFNENYEFSHCGITEACIDKI